MKRLSAALIILSLISISLVLAGCGKHAIKYSLDDCGLRYGLEHKLAVKELDDARPQEERTGKTSKFLKFASKDSHFKSPVTESIQDALVEEFNQSGLDSYEYRTNTPCRYLLTGQLNHFHAALQLPKTTVVPYLKTVASMWTKDEFIIAVEIKVDLEDTLTGKSLLDKTYTFKDDKKLPSGLFNLARYGRGFNYKLKLLDEALSSVLEDIRDDVLQVLIEQ